MKKEKSIDDMNFDELVNYWNKVPETNDIIKRAKDFGRYTNKYKRNYLIVSGLLIISNLFWIIKELIS